MWEDTFRWTRSTATHRSRTVVVRRDRKNSNFGFNSNKGVLCTSTCRLPNLGQLRNLGQVIYFPAAEGTSLAMYRALRNTSCWDCADSNELSHATGGHSYRSHDAHNRHVVRTKGGSAAFTFVLAGCESPRMRGALLATVSPPSVGTARPSIRAVAELQVSLGSGIDPAARLVHYRNWASH